MAAASDRDSSSAEVRPGLVCGWSACARCRRRFPV